MLPRRGWRAVLVAVVAVSLLPTMAAASAERGPHRHAERIVGFDGVEYESSPLVVEGSHGDLFLGLEFDLACAWGGGQFEQGMRRLARLARVIEDSGRRAIFSVAPGKADVMRQHLPAAALPQGACDTASLTAQRRLLDTFPDPTYVGTREVIARDHRQTYWKTDQHWTEVAVSDYATELARALDPVLARRQRYRKASQTEVGYLNNIRGVDVTETVPSVEYAGKVTVTTAKDSPWPMGSGHTDMRWDAKPTSKTWPGHTLLMGDSFTMVGLGSLAPLFRHGRFLWNNNFSDQAVAEAIADSDTVVIEVVQWLLYGSTVGTASLRKAVKRELRKHPYRG
jgi:hypothetical protein